MEHNISAMSSGGLELLTIKLQQMNIESTNNNISTNPAITYSKCYAPFIIFLDIDGVFNCQLFYKSQQFNDYKEAKKSLRKSLKAKEIEMLDYYQSQICRERIGWFNKLCKEVNAVVVISSTWRMGKTIEQLQEIMDYCGGTFKIIGKTDYNGYERGTEISKWLKDNIKPKTHGCHYFDFHRYAIIDDDSDMLLNQKEHFFQTDNYSGLTPTTCYKIKRFITGRTFNEA